MRSTSFKMEIVSIRPHEGCNVILGQSHFIKTVEDIYEALVNTVPGIKFGIDLSSPQGNV